MDYKSIAELIGVLPDYLTLPILYIIRYYFYKNFLGFKKKTRWFILASLLLIIFDFITSAVAPDFLMKILYDTLLFLSICFLCSENFIIKLYSVVVEDAILLLINLSFLPFSFWINPIIHNISMSFRNHMIINFIQGFCLSIISYVILYFLLKTICCCFKLKNNYINLSQSLYLLIPCLSSYGLALIFFFIQKVKIANIVYYLPNISPKLYYIMLPFISFLLLISIPIMAYIFNNMLENEEQKQKHILMEQQFTLQIKHIQNVEDLYLGIRKVTHDMNNHISCLTNLAANNNLNEIKNYLHNISETVSNLELKIKTGNPISDAVINEKFNIAKAENINLISDFMLPPQISLEAIDLCIILSNSLDNAIEACRNITASNIERKISLKSYIRDLYLIIEVSNTTTDKLKYVNNKIISRKSNKVTHGIGISNIEDVVKKYNGILDIVEEKNYFTLSLMLKISEK